MVANQTVGDPVERSYLVLMDETEPPSPTGRPENAAPGKLLSPAARRALEEAQARREAERARQNQDLPPEDGGPTGEEPTRYGDWERGGIAYDF